MSGQPQTVTVSPTWPMLCRAEQAVADAINFLRPRRNCDGSITLTPAEVKRLADLLGNKL